MNGPHITGLRVRPVDVPLKFPVHTAIGTVATAPLVLIDLETDSGITGCAYVFTYTRLALGPTMAMLDSLRHQIVGEPLAPQALERKLERSFRLLGYTGIVRMACAGIDMAAWDAL